MSCCARRPGVSDLWIGRRKAFEPRAEAFPVQAPGFPAPAPGAAQPCPADLPMECAQRREVRHAAVAVMAAQNAGTPAVLLGQRRVHVPRRVLAQRLQLARQALALRFALHDEPAVARPPAVAGEPENGEGSRTLPAALSSGQGRQAAELDQSRLVLVERQAEPGQPFLEVRQHPPGVGRVLEAHDESVGTAHDRNPTARLPAAPLADPEIEDAARKDLGEERADPSPLRRPFVRFKPLAAFQGAGFEPHPDEPGNPGGGNPMRQHPQPPLVVNQGKDAFGAGTLVRAPRRHQGAAGR